MQLTTGTIVAVADGEKLKLFRNTGQGDEVKLAAMDVPAVETGNHGSGARHHSSSANPDHGQQDEDEHSAGVAALLNKQVVSGAIKQLLVIASPRSLGEMRKHFSKELTAVLVGELAKDLAGRSIPDIEKSITSG